jgi:RHS repeat-associated protein
MLKRTRNPRAGYFHSDHLGSSTFLTDADGNPYQFLLYLPFGETLAEQKSGGFSTQYRFNGKEQDQMTGLYNYGARFYDPMVSGWLSVDPLTEKYPGWSAYNYVMNNPVRLIDPTGMGAEDYYETSNGNVIWRNSSEATLIENGQTLKNIGTSYASFNGSSLTYNYQYKDKDGNLSPSYISLRAVSGRADENGQFDYSLERQMMGDVGPIPEGKYKINLNEQPNMTAFENIEGLIGAGMGLIGLKKRGTFPGGKYAWGDGRIDINPDKVTVPNTDNPFDIIIKRGGFTIHGGKEPGSAGCIDLCNGFSVFKSMINKYSGSSPSVNLKVKYNLVGPINSPF